jgi:hypothetical protein
MQLSPAAPPSASTEDGPLHASPLSLLFRAIGLVNRSPPPDVADVGTDADTAGASPASAAIASSSVSADGAAAEVLADVDAEVDELEEGAVTAADAEEAGVAADGSAEAPDALSKWQLQQIYRVTQV